MRLEPNHEISAFPTTKTTASLWYPHALWSSKPFDPQTSVPDATPKHDSVGALTQHTNAASCLVWQVHAPQQGSAMLLKLHLEEHRRGEGGNTKSGRSRASPTSLTRTRDRLFSFVVRTWWFLGVAGLLAGHVRAFELVCGSWTQVGCGHGWQLQPRLYLCRTYVAGRQSHRQWFCQRQRRKQRGP